MIVWFTKLDFKMLKIKFIAILILFCTFSNNCFSQIIQKTGDLFSEIATKISTMPSDAGNDYFEPNNAQLATWENTLNQLLNGDYSAASDAANTIGYNLINFTDTTTLSNRTYFILETVDTNYWGTYVFNPDYCRPLVIQSPHSKRDANTGHQGIYAFQKTEGIFYQVNGTHRCNSLASTTCTGNTTSCSGTSEPYRISDLAHTTQSIFQKTTEVLFNTFDDSHFIQLHGFTKLTTDPYLILSNGTQVEPAIDFMSDFKENLLIEDPVLTFKLAHIDTDWTRLRGFWNTQSRLVNGSFNHCNADATSTNGRFFHVEQERSRLRSDVEGWDKIANALINTFACNAVSTEEGNFQNKIKVYPNPTTHTITIEGAETQKLNKQQLVYNLLGQNMSQKVTSQNEQIGKTVIDLDKLPTGFYFVKFEKSIFKIFKN